MKISVFGTGYVGLVTGLCFAELENKVICMDIDEKKVAKLKAGEPPIYEENLETLLNKCLKSQKVSFTTDFAEAVHKSDILFIAVGTPQDENGLADLRAVLSVAQKIGQTMNSSKVLVVKSTVPVGTCAKVQKAVSEELKKRDLGLQVDVVSNPEFLKEGAAIEDCLHPDRVIVGTDSEKCRQIMAELYLPMTKRGAPIIFMGITSAELTKYAANAMLATRISFMNQLAMLCERFDADVECIREGIGADPRIGKKFLAAGVGYGGSCFPKDVVALIQSGKSVDVDMSILQSVDRINKAQRQWFFDRVKNYFKGNLTNKSIALWGLAFKPGTDDVREAPAIDFVKWLLKEGALVKATDPIAISSAKLSLGPLSEKVLFSEDRYETLKNADALILCTEWPQFKSNDFEKMGQLMAQKAIFDGRNFLESSAALRSGFAYHSVGQAPKLN